MDRPEMCPECKGAKGFVSTSESLGGTLPGWSDCPTCQGTGEVSRPLREKLPEVGCEGVTTEPIN